MSLESQAMGRRDWLANAIRSEFVRQIVGTLGTRVGIVAAGLVTSVLVARSLGPEGRGTLAIAGAVTALAIQFGNLGLHASNTWAVARDPKLVAPLIANSILASLVIGALEIIVILAIQAIAPEAVPISGLLLTIALLAIPIGLASLLLQNLLLGLQQIRDYNLLELATRGLSIVTIVALIVAGRADPVAFLIAGTAVALGIAVATAGRLARLSVEQLRPRLSLLRTYGSFGLKAYTTALISYLVIRVDLFFIQSFRGFEDTGQYSIAVSVIDLMYMLPVVVGTLLFPRLARMESRRSQVRFARDVAVRIGLLMAAGGAVAYALAEPGITVLYGSAFAPAVPAFQLLLPGIVALSIHTVFMNYAAAAGMPMIVVVAPAAGLLVNIVLNLVLIPRYGIIGASLASSAAYGLMLIMSAAYFFRQFRAFSADPAEVSSQ